MLKWLLLVYEMSGILSPIIPCCVQTLLAVAAPYWHFGGHKMRGCQIYSLPLFFNKSLARLMP